ncbi:MAG: hypothetical protein PHD06_08995 [Bacteroidales bacterium]|nr:hypothetical protein [Bacteroidales bacterium]MDD4385299.1 hypothetical protein [Bacteroidales bacterium]MDY0199325.1 hypothetical protein [Tenuifilaceae bacterium]
MLKLKYRLAIIVLVTIALGFGCSTINPFIKEDFNRFYSQFHSDSTFQLSRIHFPIEGMIIDGFGERPWSKENWTLLTIPVFEVDTTRFEVDFIKGEKTFTQKSWIENSGFAAEYRFELRKRKWNLVYALEQNL